MNNKELSEVRIAKICAATGWDKQTAEAALNHAAELGITDEQYVSQKAWEFSESELIELKQILDLDEESRKETERWHILVACEKTGAPYEEMAERLRIVKEKGYGERVFIRKCLYLKSIDELKEMPKPKKSKPSERKPMRLKRGNKSEPITKSS